MINTTIYHQLESEGKSKTFRNRPGPPTLFNTRASWQMILLICVHMITSRKLLDMLIRYICVPMLSIRACTPTMVYSVCSYCVRIRSKYCKVWRSLYCISMFPLMVYAFIFFYRQLHLYRYLLFSRGWSIENKGPNTIENRICIL